MNSFSILPFQHQSILDAYQQWLVSDLYQNCYFDNLNDPNFLQKLSLLQAEGIRHDIGMHAAVTHGSIQEATSQVGQKIRSVASLITSSLDDGFLLMNTRMTEVNSNLRGIGQGVGAVNQTLQQSNQILSSIEGGINQMNRGIGAVASGINALNSNVTAGLSALNQNMNAGIVALSENISQAASVILYQLQQSEVILKQILDELRIPESQRERRYHIEEGMKYFNKGMQSGDCLYFEDALDEFTTATTIERKDFFSWYYIGMIYLYSKEHLDPEKALSAFDRYIHYADALPQKHNLFDEAYLMKAECKYLMQDIDAAFGLVEKVMTGSEKAALRGMKYLSASNDTFKQQQAVEILKHLMQSNPFVVMQVLEDYDLLSNNYVKEYLNDLKTKTTKEINHLVFSCDKKMEELKKFPLTYYKDIFDELNSLKARVRTQDLGLVDAFMLKEKIQAMPETIENAVNDADKRTISEQLLTLAQSIRNEIASFKAYTSFYETISQKVTEQEARINLADKVIETQIRKELNIIPEILNEFRKDSDIEYLIALKDSTGKYGYHSRRSGRIIIPHKWMEAYPFSEGLAAVKDNNGKWGFIDKTGSVVLPNRWEGCFSGFHEGLASVKDMSGKWGYIDKRGQLIIPCQWVSAYEFSEGMAVVCGTNFKYGYIDKQGQVVIPNKWGNAHRFKEGIASVSGKGIDVINGHCIVPQSGYIDKKGSVVIPCRWYHAGDFQDGLAVFSDNTEGKFGIIDKRGNVISPCQWISISPFSEGLAIVMDLKREMGFVDTKGQLVIPCQWQNAEDFKYGTAIVHDHTNGLKSGVINKRGQIVIPILEQRISRIDNLFEVVEERSRENVVYYDNTGIIVKVTPFNEYIQHRKDILLY